ncbi:hypothetical protein IMSAGC020_01464 [Lachnospiraceae bacterium]|jgi:hypothetical protein|nr:hypothetical protein IMSAGC020_01464 [Lachnospiraceae bacterium]
MDYTRKSIVVDTKECYNDSTEHCPAGAAGTGGI